MTSGIELTSKEYTITLSDNNLQYVIDNDLVEPIKSAVYEIEGIDLILYSNFKEVFIVDVLDVEIDPKSIYAKIIKVIATHRLSAKP